MGDQADRLKFTEGPRGKQPGQLKLGKGLEGRVVDGKRVYTVLVSMAVEKGGKVSNAHVERSDAPERLQWATVKAAKAMRVDPSLKPGRYYRTFIFHDLDVKPG